MPEELDDTITESAAKEAMTREKLNKSLSDVQHLENANKSLSRVIRDMEIERENVDRAREECDRRTQNLERDLKRAEYGYGEVVASKERLEEDRSLVLQQLSDANQREKRNLQLIQDLEQEIRHNVRSHREADLASARQSETSMASLADRVVMDRTSNQADSHQRSHGLMWWLPFPCVLQLPVASDTGAAEANRRLLCRPPPHSGFKRSHRFAHLRWTLQIPIPRLSEQLHSRQLARMTGR